MTGVLGQALTEGGISIKGSEPDYSNQPEITEKVPPKGHVGFPPKGYNNPHADKNERVKAHIDKCYSTLSNPQSTKEQIDQANREITAMLGEAIRGFRQSGRIMRINVMQCQKCQSPMEGDTCQTCGWTVPQNQK